ncbi:caspase family protein [Flammeovirga sp. SubArs3]|uniref:caspase family protein n=1 Tax=Flammeovirga sp. SubArs3 TaxID=2995316 RepID=UPI00248D37C7|nr:caspase family protein [Flammeovirga sp. SubArs3]
MKFLVPFFLFCSLFTSSLFAVEKHALIIGIDSYMDSNKARFAEWQNLDGAVNDATSIYNILKAKYGFSSKNMKLLTSEKSTTKKSIQKNFDALIKKVAKGDQVFVYYAGHGAQISNSKFYEADKKHEAIVPSDVLRTGEYLLDVEINNYLYQVTQKGGELVVVFDNCFSGSGTRGKIDIEELKSRYVPVDDIDVNQEFPLSKSIVDEGALVVSAAQDYQLAKEYKDSRGQSHGVFTYSLMKALQMSSVHESADDIFKRVNSIILYNSVPRQDPVVEATEERLSRPLFGKVADAKQGVHVAVIDAEAKFKITLDGGAAIGLVPGAELTYGEDEIVVKVTRLFGVNGCYGEIIKGENKLEEGYLLKVTKWAPFSPNRLKVTMTDIGITTIEEQGLKELAVYLNDGGIMAYSPLDAKVGMIIHKNGKNYEAIFNGRNPVSLGSKVPSISKIESLKKKDLEAGELIYLEIPPTTKVFQSIQGDLSAQPKVELVKESDVYDYRLIGRYNENNQLEYAWLRAHAHNNTNHNPFPDETMWKSEDKVYVISDFAKRLGNMKGWLVTNVPANEANFPYKFGLQKESDQTLVKEGALIEGEKYGMVIYKDPNLFEKWNGNDRYLYIFLLESNGEMTLLFPANGVAVENFTEQICQDKKGNYKDKIALSDSDLISIEPPFTTDNILMLSSKAIITDTSIFEQKGVSERGEQAALDDILNETGRGKKKDAANWYLERHTYFGEGIK